MLINNSTRILDDTWDRDKWKTIATGIRKPSVVINVLILAGLKRDGRACSWSRREWGREEIQAHLPCWHVLNEKERRNHFPLPVPCSYFAKIHWFKWCLVPCFGYSLLCLYGSPNFWLLWILAIVHSAENSVSHSSLASCGILLHFTCRFS